MTPYLQKLHHIIFCQVDITLLPIISVMIGDVPNLTKQERSLR